MKRTYYARLDDVVRLSQSQLTGAVLLRRLRGLEPEQPVEVIGPAPWCAWITWPSASGLGPCLLPLSGKPRRWRRKVDRSVRWTYRGEVE